MRVAMAIAAHLAQLRRVDAPIGFHGGAASRARPRGLRDRDFAGRDMDALAFPVERLAHLVRPGIFPPAAQLQTQAGIGVRGRREAGRQMQVLERRLARRDVPAMSVEEIEVAESLRRQRCHVVAHHRHQRRGAQADGAGKAEIELRDAERDGRADQDVAVARHAARDRFGADGVGADGPDRAVLLGRAERHDDPARAAQIGLDVGPGRVFEDHAEASGTPGAGVKPGARSAGTRTPRR
jgi:hypothetical protein